jgi:hypothetical protein
VRLAAVTAVLFLVVLFCLSRRSGSSALSVFSLGLLSSSSSGGGGDFQLETVRYHDLSNVQGTARGWEREERILVCVPLRDAEEHLPMFFSHLRNLTYPHHLIDLAFLVSDSKDKTLDALTRSMEEIQGWEDDEMHFGEISIIEKDFGQKVNQDVESRHGFEAQASRRKLMARARNWLLTAALRPYHSWVYWRDVDVETAPFTILEDLMRHNKDVIVPSECWTGRRWFRVGIADLKMQMSGVRSRIGSAESSRTISTRGRSRTRPCSSPRRSTRMLSLSRVTPSTPRTGRIWRTCETRTAIPMWKWSLTASAA